MPANRVNQTLYLGQYGDIENFLQSDLYKGGELGSRVIDTEGKEYQVVKLDSGATASAGPGLVVAGDLAFIKAKASYLVTNDLAQAQAAESASHNAKRNMVCGVFVRDVSAAQLGSAGTHVLIQTRGRRATVKSDGGGDFVAGDKCIAANAATAVIDRVAAGTAPPNTNVGTVAAAESGGFTAVNLELPGVDF